MPPTASRDVFTAAIEMETIGRDFYAALAQAGNNAKIRGFCATAAAQEAQHMATFQRLRSQWLTGARSSSHPVPHPAALTALAKRHIQPDPQTVRNVALSSNVTDALNMAIQMECDAVEFYQELMAQMPAAVPEIQQIIAEELSHLSSLRAMVA